MSDPRSRTSPDPLTDRVNHPDYPRSSQYDARWAVENQMGPNALWLLEWLAPALGLDALRPCARVLDLGCGRAMTSIFLAREFHAQVTAADLWVKPDDNARRIAEGGSPTACCPCTPRPMNCPSPRAVSTRSSVSTPISTSAPTTSICPRSPGC